MRLSYFLVDEGKIGRDDPVEKYLPGVVPNGANITIRQMLDMTSALQSLIVGISVLEGRVSGAGLWHHFPISVSAWGRPVRGVSFGCRADAGAGSTASEDYLYNMQWVSCAGGEAVTFDCVFAASDCVGAIMTPAVIAGSGIR